jgi:hypothetical protein
MSEESQDNEISLIDLFVVLWHRIKLFQVYLLFRLNCNPIFNF